jgi:hypothetical protein
MIELHDLISPARESLFTELDGETILVGMHSGAYYGLNATGRCIWELLPQNGSIESLCAALRAKFEVSEDVCRTNVGTFVNTLFREKLIEVVRCCEA